jgi:hypothetical protein
MMNVIGEADHNFITIGDDESLLAINALIYMNIIFLTGKAGSMRLVITQQCRNQSVNTDFRCGSD